MGKFKNMLFWFLKELPLFVLPFAISQLALWITVSRFIRVKKFTDKPVVAFTSIHYNGNSKAVFEYMKNLGNYECFWIARNRKSLKDIRESNGHCIYAYLPLISMKSLLNTNVLVTSDTAFQSLFFHKKPKVIQLWHGVCPKGLTLPEYDFDVWCMSSEYIKQRYIKLYGLSPEKLHVTGYAGLDTLFKYLQNDSIRDEFCKKYSIRGKIILYAPTWDCGLWGWGDQYNQFERMCLFCRKNDITLILRLHPLVKISKRKLRKIVDKYEVLWLNMDKEPDTMKLLAVSDILITDWSSISTDFLLTKRPVIFLEVNKEYFTKTRGEPEVLPEYRSGEIVLDAEQFYDALETVLSKGNRFEKKQKEFLKLLHGNVDGKASERVLTVIEELIKDKK